MTEIDSAYGRARRGDHEGFSDWVRRVELPLRGMLRSFARSVDVEAVLQEGLLRMWTLAPTLELQGENASLRYATVLVRNLASNEAKRLRTTDQLDHEKIEHDPGLARDPDPPADPGLRRVILGCIEKMPRQPRRALLARLESDGTRRDATLATGLGMQAHTFRQNIVRARRNLADCLESHGVPSTEFVR